MRKPGEVYEKDGEVYIVTDIGTSVQVTTRSASHASMRAMVLGSVTYADIAVDAWTMNPQLSAELRPHLPSERDILGEMRRYMPPGVELMPGAAVARYFVCEADPSRQYEREKFYTRCYMPNEAAFSAHETKVEANVDFVRSAVFDAVKLVAERIRQSVEIVRASLRPPPGASVEYRTAMASPIDTPIAVRFMPGGVLHTGSRYSDSFVAYDMMSDQITMAFGSYFTVTPA